MKKKIIYVVITIAVVAVLALGFQFIPKTLTFDFESNPIEAVIITYVTDPANPHIRTVYRPNQAQISELKSRLKSLSGAKKTCEYNYATTMASIEIDLGNGKSVNFQSKSDGTLLLIWHQPKTKYYYIDNEEFLRYVMTLCSGGDRASGNETENANKAVSQIQGEAGTIYWEISDGVLTISGTGVVEYEPWLEHPDVSVDMITELVVEDGITDFSYSTFGNYDALKAVELGAGFTYIPPEEFIGCTNLTKFHFGENVTFIDGGAFERCGFKTLVIPDSITFINIGAFANCAELEKITIPASVTEIGEGTFDGCDKLTIYGSSGSYAETYAAENGIAFSVL